MNRPRPGMVLFMGRIQKTSATLRGEPAKAAPADENYRGFRRLAWNEVVYHGDYVADERAELKPWEGLSGFRAGSFVQSIYRKETPANLGVPALKSDSRNVKET